MNQCVKRADDTLLALGFRKEPHPYKRGKFNYSHANEPETVLSLWAGMSDAAASKVIAHAEAIIGLAHTETDRADRKAKEESAAKKRAAAELKRYREARERIATRKEAAIAEARRRQYEVRQSRGTLTTEDRLMILADIRQQHIDPLRIVDELCIPERVVREAINDERLIARMHPGKRILCAVPDVRAWVKAGAC